EAGGDAIDRLAAAHLLRQEIRRVLDARQLPGIEPHAIALACHGDELLAAEAVAIEKNGLIHKGSNVLIVGWGANPNVALRGKECWGLHPNLRGGASPSPPPAPAPPAASSPVPCAPPRTGLRGADPSRSPRPWPVRPRPARSRSECPRDRRT